MNGQPQRPVSPGTGCEVDPSLHRTRAFGFLGLGLGRVGWRVRADHGDVVPPAGRVHRKREEVLEDIRPLLDLSVSAAKLRQCHHEGGMVDENVLNAVNSSYSPRRAAQAELDHGVSDVCSQGIIRAVPRN